MSTQLTNRTGTKISARLENFFARIDPARGRLILGIDATASRQPTWDQASHLQSQMFAAVAAVGALDVQLTYYRGFRECVASRWLSDAKALGDIMAKVTCSAGVTQIARVLSHTRREHTKTPVNALILISDACEEIPGDLFDEAAALGNVPVFLFQEGDSAEIARTYAEIARITGGAHCKFDASAAQRLADLLKAEEVITPDKKAWAKPEQVSAPAAAPTPASTPASAPANAVSRPQWAE